MIQVIDKAFDILELIATEPDKGWPLGSIADPLSMNHGTCANILKTMVKRRYVEKLPAKKGYKLGSMAYKLSDKRNYQQELINIAEPEMSNLSATFNENTLLSVLDGNSRRAILRINSSRQLQVITPTEKEAYDSSTGRLLIALQSDENIERFLQQYGLPAIKNQKRAISKKTFLSEVEKIRNAGYVEYLPDDEILGIAFPIYQKNKIIASISIYAPAFRCKTKIRVQMKDALQQAAQRITEKMNLL